MPTRRRRVKQGAAAEVDLWRNVRVGARCKGLICSYERAERDYGLSGFIEARGYSVLDWNCLCV